jgi:single-strand DNA-binding protein
MNKLMITGNLTRDPETRTTQNGKTICSFTVAVNERKKNADGTTMSSFFRVGAFGELGELCQKYLSKSSKVLVSGPVFVTAYIGRDGNPKASMEVTAQEVEFLSKREHADEARGDGA